MSPDNLRSMQVDSVCEGNVQPAGELAADGTGGDCPDLHRAQHAEGQARRLPLPRWPLRLPAPPMQIYIVGGAVRDELLGRPVADRDYVVVGASPQAMLDRVSGRSARISRCFCIPQTTRSTRSPAPSARPDAATTASPFMRHRRLRSKKTWRAAT
jgi:hypothetical protein